MNEAIQKAIEGGYRKGQADFILNMPEFALSQVWLDPLFWQALGKSLGWPDLYSEDVTPSDRLQEYWTAVWHRFIDHIAEGGDIEEFFKGLIK